MTRFSGCVLTAALLSCTAFAADWPQWRGPERSGISQETGLLSEWPKEGPKVRWIVKDLGTGYSSPVVSKGIVYTQTTQGNEEFAVALSEKTGKKIWTEKIGVVGKNEGPQYPGTRATPTVDGDKIYCLSSDGELVCLTRDGKKVWEKNIRKEFKGEVGKWAYTESVLVDGDHVICTPGGSEATLAALKKDTGEVVWKSAVPGGDVADYASIMIVEAGGRKQYVQYMRKALVGVDAKTGKFLWSYDRTQDQGASILTPIVAGNKVFVSGSRKGGGLVALSAEGDGVAAKEIYFDKAIAPSTGGAILYKGHLYGTAGVNMFCADFETGKVKWTDRSVAPASLCLADGKIYARGWNTGDIALIDPSPESYKEISRFKQPMKSKILGWTHPIVANGGFYVRDQDVLICFEVGKDVKD
jgi:outer membrane protein assembly factor BamB